MYAPRPHLVLALLLVALLAEASPARAESYAYFPDADARVEAASPSSNFGASTVLKVDGSPVIRSYLKFTLHRVPAASTVNSATLQLTLPSSLTSHSGIDVYAVADNGWSELALNSSNAPALGPLVASSGPVTAGQVASVPVGSVVDGPGIFSFALTTESSVSLSPRSKESTGPNPNPFGSEPRLVVDYQRPEQPVPVSPVVMAAGDIACRPGTSRGTSTNGNCHQKDTSMLLLNHRPDAVLPLGDLQYNCTEYSLMTQSYGPTWGRTTPYTRPAIGNHEYKTALNSPTSGCLNPDPDNPDSVPGKGYFDYFNGLEVFNGLAGPRDTGYYSYNIGDWHLIALNSNCEQLPDESCALGSQQEHWLRADLASNTKSCVLAYWHHPRFSSGIQHGSDSKSQPLWRALADYRADIVLNAHSHTYERFGKLSGSADSNGRPVPDPGGMRLFVVGTGGRSHYTFGPALPGSQARDATTFGVLKLALHPGGYDWEFVPDTSSGASGVSFSDAGGDQCNRAGPGATPPTPPANLTATASGSGRVQLSWIAASDDSSVVGYEVFREGQLLATIGDLTSYADTNVLPGTTYSYQVRARDAEGNRSEPSNTATVTTPTSTGTTVTFLPDADARAQEASPGSNYATSHLRADGGSDPDVESYLRFSVSGLQGPVTSAKLRVRATTPTSDGPAVSAAGDGWAETGLDWSNRPAPLGGATDDAGVIASGAWVEYDVTALVAGEGSHTFVLATTSPDGLNFDSREVPGREPHLVVSSG
jgi:acid phosphatase type 7